MNTHRQGCFICRKMNKISLFCYCLYNSLTYPPHSIRNKFKAFGFVEALGSLNQTNIAFINKIRKRESLELVLFGYRNHKSKVGFGEAISCFLVPGFNATGENYFF